MVRAVSVHGQNFADDTTFYVGDKDLNTLINRLEYDTSLAVEWFESKFMKLNLDKCHLLVSGHKHETVWAKTGLKIVILL